MSVYNHEQQKLSVCEHIPDRAQTTPYHHPPLLDRGKSSPMSLGPMALFFLTFDSPMTQTK